MKAIWVKDPVFKLGLSYIMVFHSLICDTYLTWLCYTCYLLNIERQRDCPDIKHWHQSLTLGREITRYHLILQLQLEHLIAMIKTTARTALLSHYPPFPPPCDLDRNVFFAKWVGIFLKIKGDLIHFHVKVTVALFAFKAELWIKNN